ncbi:ATP-dependent DNA helicase Mph1p [[Candida] jaroonii]|uniref:ATP-dependent DNA helicase Mph1p n=1 Tax=[Candida] jaroonii TaxID=467808 RepID=A0ACA9Y3G9_9ASCO|nr:ATP-dependent DNA helicase Mph1p [[Candida] jaroonii]
MSDDFDDEFDAILQQTNAVNEAITRSTSLPPPRSEPQVRSHRQVRSALDSHQNKKRRVQTNLLGEIIESVADKTVDEIRKPPTERPTHHSIDHESLKSYIYPINYEIRDYQYNIIEKSFYHNILVALPTGLGKTFIAATTILNYFRWFPESKIVFMAPTKPLVAQQIKACFSIIGLQDQAAILLDKSKRNRREVWDGFRIFFTTPQVVENDLCNGLIDPKTISLLIIDEAHKAKGNYAYNNVVKYLDRFNHSYRIMALTATPAATVEGVKEIIENLSITKVEIRTENSIDIIRYFKGKKIDKIDINFTENNDINEYIVYLSNAVEPLLKVANDRKIIQIDDALKLNSFRLLEIQKKNMANPGLGEGMKWSNHFLIKMLVFIANCFKKLKIYGVVNFIDYFNDQALKNKKTKNRLLIEFYENENIIKLKDLINNYTNNSQGEEQSHPKIVTLIDYLENFLETTTYDNSKVIIFTEFRDSALEIVKSIEKLNKDQLRPHIFIGQASESSDKSSNSKINKGRVRTSSEDAKLKGMNQKVQKQLIKDFKNDKYNILVATSIGEEGLDIGEVDLIICYDSTSSPIKNVQRLGRTGRKRDGQICLLFSDNERSKFEKAMDNYEWIQNYIMKHESELVVLKSNRILPPGSKPLVEKKLIQTEEMEEEDEDEIIKIAMDYMKGKKSAKKTKTKTKTKEKSKAKEKKKFNMPDDAITGFMNVTDLLKKQEEEKHESEHEEKAHDSGDSQDLIDTDSFFAEFSSEKPTTSANHTSSFEQKKPIEEPKAKDSVVLVHNILSQLEFDEFDEFDDEPAPKPKVGKSEYVTESVPKVSNEIANFDDFDEFSDFDEPKPEIKSEPTSLTNRSESEDFDDDLLETMGPNVQVPTLAKDAIPEKPASKHISQKAEMDEFDEFDSNDPVEMSLPPTTSTANGASIINDSLDELDEFDSMEILPSPRQSTQELLAPNSFSAQDGFLSSQEKMELFTNYYNPLPAEPLSSEPQVNVKSSKNSKKTKRFFKLMTFMNTINEKTSKRDIEVMKRQLSESDNSVENCIKYLNDKI